MESPFDICIDVDGTIFDYDQYVFQKWGPLKVGARLALCRFKDLGYRVTLFTSRSDVEYDALVDRLRQEGLLQCVDRIQFGKPNCEVYIDDRAVCYDGSWGEVAHKVDDLIAKKGRNLG